MAERSIPPIPGPPADPFGWVGAVLETHFAVEAVAGDGGFGLVYRGRHLGLDVPIAIKLLKLPAQLGEEERRRFLARLQREARIMHRLSRQTPGIVQALHVGAATSPTGIWAPYLVMEWAEGDTLERHLAAQRRAGAAPAGLPAAAGLLSTAAAAIAAMHGAGVAHLDLKPANLVFAGVGAGAALKVLDFGVARAFAESPGLTAPTTRAADQPRAFTPQYGAPEQFSRQYGAPGPWTDVFAMALVLAEVASGRRVLEGETVMQLFVAAIHEDARGRWIERIPRVTGETGAVLLRALEVSRELRFQTMSEFWAALGEALSSEARRTAPSAGGEPAAPSRFTTQSIAPIDAAPPRSQVPEARTATEEPVATTGTGQAAAEATDAPELAPRAAASPRVTPRRILGAALPFAALLAAAPSVSTPGPPPVLASLPRGLATRLPAEAASRPPPELAAPPPRPASSDLAAAPPPPATRAAAPPRARPRATPPPLAPPPPAAEPAPEPAAFGIE